MEVISYINWHAQFCREIDNERNLEAGGGLSHETDSARKYRGNI